MCETCDRFVHLHVHSEYSLLDGLSRIPDLAKRAKTLDQPALALTDHGVMFGAIEFYLACRAAGVNPIIGMEGYVAARGMTDRDPELDRRRFHLLLLARNKTGYLNLLQTASAAQLEGYYYRPRVDHAFMAAHADGLIATSGCLAAEIPRALADGRERDAHRLLGLYLDIYGRENFYLELQEHGIPELSRVNRELIALAPRFGLQERFVLTNDVHYTTRAEADPHEVLLCIQTGSTVKNPKLTLSNKEYYLKSAEEMRRLFAGYPDAVVANAFQNTVRIAEQCTLDLDLHGYHLPIFEPPPGHSPATYLRALCQDGLVWRYGAARAADDDNLRRRLEHELAVIGRMGFETYFLIVWDLCEFARRSRRWWDQHGATFFPTLSYAQWAERDIWWNVRGSGAGSLVAYCLGITGIDPIANGLIFERFLNPGRVSMPDIDLDYPDDSRHEMVGYALRRYGAEKVAQIIAFGTMKARASIRDVGRAMEIPLERVDEIARMVPAVAGKKIELKNLFEEGHEFYSKEFCDLYAADAQARTLIDAAQQLEGVSRHATSHPAGVVISDRPLVEYVPLHRPTSGEAGLGGIDRVTQWPMEIIEEIGLLKVDFLGLSTLTVMREAAQLIAARHGVRYTMENIPYDVGHVGPDPQKEPQTLFEMLGRGEVSGVFQVEGAGMRRLMMDMRPQRFDHIIAAISLYRPGPMEQIPAYIRRMHGQDPVEYHHPALEPILGDTYGVVIYQEQIIRTAAELAGYEPGEADMIRKAVSKKKQDLIDKHRVLFIGGGEKKGYPRSVMEAIWGDIEFFARYGFNKSHAADYAVITCQTAFLKAHYPVEYMAALLSVEREKTDKVTKYLAEARRMGIQVAPPDINAANIPFTIEDRPDRAPVIRFGFGAIKNAGEAALQTLLDERQAGGPFRNAQDLCERVDLRKIGSRALESMIKVGVFDGWGSRSQFLEGLRRLIGYSGKHQDERASAQLSLFGLLGAGVPVSTPDLLRPIGEVPELPQRQLLDWERELIGAFLSAHPLEAALIHLEPYVTARTADLDENSNGKTVRLGGMITGLRPYSTKSGDAMAFAVLEDLEGKVDLVFFPRTWQKVRDQARIDQIVLVTGKVNLRDDSVSVVVEDLRTSVESVRPLTDAVDLQPSLNDYAWSRADEPPAPHFPVVVAPPVTAVLTDPDDDPDAPPLSWELDEAPLPRIAPARRPAVAEPSPAPLAVHAVAPEPPGFDPRPPEPDDDPPTDLPPAPAAKPEGALPPGNGRTAPPPPARPTPRQVTVAIDPTADWRAAMRRALQIADQFDGPDRLVLRLAGSAWVIDFPKRGVRFGDDLARALSQTPGVQGVSVS